MALAVLLALSLAGCATGGADDAPADDPSQAGDVPSTQADEPLVVFDGEQAWPLVPVETTAFAFDVPAARQLSLFLNWRGQQPGGFSSMRAAVAIAPDGSETELLGGDLPANPYACASSTCGPSDDRRFTFDDPLPGPWRVELRGAFTATATLRAEVMA